MAETRILPQRPLSPKPECNLQATSMQPQCNLNATTIRQTDLALFGPARNYPDPVPILAVIFRLIRPSQQKTCHGMPMQRDTPFK